ncbi:hypothetical protein MMC22_009088 [Lobaria immixta]|nr:hypothetical protein [Lobaria immixta]
MALGHRSNGVSIIIGRSVKHLRPETIYLYLPNYYLALTDNNPIAVHPEKLIHADRITCKALRYLFDYLEEIDQGIGTSTALSDRLISARHGPYERRNLFMALGRILHTECFGCHLNLQSIMKAYVMWHCADIVRGRIGGWIDYVNALEGIGIDRTEMAQVLSYIMNEYEKNYGLFYDYGSDGRLSYKILHLLDRLKIDADKRHARARQSCEHCSQRPAHGHGDRRMIRPMHTYGDHEFYGRWCFYSDCGRSVQVRPGRNHNLEIDAWRPVRSCKDEFEHFRWPQFRH